jgi:hypothetical protein
MTCFHDGSSVTYSLAQDAASGTFDLMQFDGLFSELPAIDRVVSLTFEYFGDTGALLAPRNLVDGPWANDAAGRPFDADLLRIRSVGFVLRVRSALGARLVPDMEIPFRAAVRNVS